MFSVSAGRIRHREIHLRAPEENEERDQKGDDRPADLEQQAAMDLCADLIDVPPAEPDGEGHDQPGDKEGKKS